MSIFRAVLFIPALIYGLITRLRNWLYDHNLLGIYKSSLYVISVGNLSAGGNAKTPLCIYLAQSLIQMGRRPVIVSRGYTALNAGPKLVLKSDAVEEVGDEPLMMSALYGLAVVIARKRKLALQLIEREKLGDIVILDDGLQHRALARDLEIVTVNWVDQAAREAFKQAELLPLGRFREDKLGALKRADLLIFAERTLAQDAADARQAALPFQIRSARSWLEPLGVFSIKSGEKLEPSKKVLAFCALANPEGFYKTLEMLGFELSAKKEYTDHHFFSRSDIKELAELSKNYRLICTEKDQVKLKEVSFEFFVLKTRLAFDMDFRTYLQENFTK